MKGSTLTLTGLVAAVIGAALIFFFRDVTSSKVVVAGGLIFVAAGLASLLVFGQKRSSGSALGKVLNQIGNTASIILGICMLVFQPTFTPLIAWIFGVLVAVCALWEFFVLAVGVRPHQLPAWVYIFPILMTAGAVYIFWMAGKGNECMVMLATGISICVLGLGCVVEGSMVGSRNRKLAAGAKAGAEAASEAAQQPREIEAAPQAESAAETASEGPQKS